MVIIELFKNICLAIYGFSGGIVISSAVFAFIAIIGIVPRLAQKTKTVDYIVIYEEAIIFGGIFGALTMIFYMHIPVGKIFAIVYSLCIGIFYGCLAICLAEVLNVIPILARRTRIQKGLALFILSLAIGKMLGSILYFFIPGFYHF